MMIELVPTATTAIESLLLFLVDFVALYTSLVGSVYFVLSRFKLESFTDAFQVGWIVGSLLTILVPRTIGSHVQFARVNPEKPPAWFRLVVNRYGALAAALNMVRVYVLLRYDQESFRESGGVAYVIGTIVQVVDYYWTPTTVRETPLRTRVRF